MNIRTDDLTPPLATPPADITLSDGLLKCCRGYFLYWRGYEAVGKSKGLVILQHGYTIHSGCDYHVAAFFARAGYNVFAPDAQGHGRSDGYRGDVVHFDDYVDDFNRCIQFAKDKFQDKRIFVVAHSTGGLISLRHELNYPGLVDAYALVSPFCGLNVALPKLVKNSASLLTQFSPTVHLSSKYASNTKTCHNQAVVDAHRKDPLVFQFTTPRWVIQSMMAQEDLKMRASEIEAPCMFIVSTDDYLADPKAAREIYFNLSSKEKVFYTLSKLYHEILNEDGWDKQTTRMVEWFESLPESPTISD